MASEKDHRVGPNLSDIVVTGFSSNLEPSKATGPWRWLPTLHESSVSQAPTPSANLEPHGELGFLWKRLQENDLSQKRPPGGYDPFPYLKLPEMICHRPKANRKPANTRRIRRDETRSAMWPPRMPPRKTPGIRSKP